MLVVVGLFELRALDIPSMVVIIGIVFGVVLCLYDCPRGGGEVGCDDANA
jgi:hypothetical protein